MLNVNDMISYSTYGLCRITEIREMVIKKQRRKYYVLSPAAEPNSTLYLPTDSYELDTKVRAPLTPEEAQAALDAGRELDFPWEPNDNSRKNEFSDIIEKGEPVKLIALIRAVCAHRTEMENIGKRLRVNDENALKSAEKIIMIELCRALEKDREDILEYLTAPEADM